jgi:hypothetical protein
MNAAIALLLTLVVLGMIRLRWERQSGVAMIFVVVIYLAYAYLSA